MKMIVNVWKRSNIILVHKKNDKQLVENYQPISHLPIFRKYFKKIIFDKIYYFLLEERLNLTFSRLALA